MIDIRLLAEEIPLLVPVQKVVEFPFLQIVNLVPFFQLFRHLLHPGLLADQLVDLCLGVLFGLELRESVDVDGLPYLGQEAVVVLLSDGGHWVPQYIRSPLFDAITYLFLPLLPRDTLQPPYLLCLLVAPLNMGIHPLLSLIPPQVHHLFLPLHLPHKIHRLLILLHELILRVYLLLALRQLLVLAPLINQTDQTLIYYLQLID